MVVKIMVSLWIHIAIHLSVLLFFSFNFISKKIFFNAQTVVFYGKREISIYLYIAFVLFQFTIVVTIKEKINK
jgi:hypothetical protein